MFVLIVSEKTTLKTFLPKFEKSFKCILLLIFVPYKQSSILSLGILILVFFLNQFRGRVTSRCVSVIVCRHPYYHYRYSTSISYWFSFFHFFTIFFPSIEIALLWLRHWHKNSFSHIFFLINISYIDTNYIRHDLHGNEQGLRFRLIGINVSELFLAGMDFDWFVVPLFSLYL